MIDAEGVSRGLTVVTTTLPLTFVDARPAIGIDVHRSARSRPGPLALPDPVDGDAVPEAPSFGVLDASAGATEEDRLSRSLGESSDPPPQPATRPHSIRTTTNARVRGTVQNLATPESAASSQAGESLDRLVVLVDQVGHHVGDGTDLVHRADDLAHRH